VGAVPGLGAMGSLRSELARARHRALHRPVDAKTTTPILLVNNVYDPATGYSQRAERLLGNAVLLTMASYGHPSYQLPSKCACKWRVRYLVHLSTPPRGTVCGAPPPFQAGSPGLPATDAPSSGLLEGAPGNRRPRRLSGPSQAGSQTAASERPSASPGRWAASSRCRPPAASRRGRALG
jgi:TAP-like protein